MTTKRIVTKDLRSTSKQNSVLCDPDEFSLKSYFLAPSAENREVLKLGLQDILEQWFDWRKKTNAEDGPFFDPTEFRAASFKREQAKLLMEINRFSQIFHSEIPRHSPRYIGHMYSEYTIPAFFGHFLALMYNPNNISSESSKVGIKIERKAIRSLSRMVGFPSSSEGHFTSGGTIANFEMLYRAKMAWARKSSKPWTLIVPESAHYCWEKGVRVFGGPNDTLTKIPLDAGGVMDVQALQQTLRRVSQSHQILGVVSVLGTTELGVFDPLDRIQEVLDETGRTLGTPIWHHVDAAYGGFFLSLIGRATPKTLSQSQVNALKALRRADSITLDPHKLGYVPYASGAFLCRKPKQYSNTVLDAPYLDYKHHRDPGPFTLEGSRTVAGPLAVLLTDRTIGLSQKGLGVILEKTLQSAQNLAELLQEGTGQFLLLDVERTNILCFSLWSGASRLSMMNKRTMALYERIKMLNSNKLHFYVSKTTLGEGQQKLIQHHCKTHGIKVDEPNLVLIRTTLMNPFFTSKHMRADLAKQFTDWIKKLANAESRHQRATNRQPS